MAGWQLQDLDLTARSDVLGRLDPRGALLLGCRLDPVLEQRMRAAGALVFPSLPDVPVDVYRSRLYTPQELYAGLEGGYHVTPDALAYSWSRSGAGDLRDLLARSLHDLSIDDALDELLRDRRVVGVMGGHDTPRGSSAYLHAAELGRSLGRAGLTVATGGGPGAMEAANLGAYLSAAPDDALPAALELLAAAPEPGAGTAAWARTAFEVRARWPGGSASLGVPTWFYGHEPPNVFASDIAKYFGNARREDVLLHVCTAGVVFLPGRAGTVQEVFQDACENYYATGTLVPPMVLVGRRFWTEELPVWPLLQALAWDRAMASHVHLVDLPAEVPSILANSGG